MGQAGASYSGGQGSRTRVFEVLKPLLLTFSKGITVNKSGLVQFQLQFLNVFFGIINCKRLVPKDSGGPVMKPAVAWRSCRLKYLYGYLF